MADPRPSWFKIDFGNVLQIATLIGGGIIFMNMTAVKGDRTADDLRSLKADVAEIRSDTKSLPGFSERVAQLERRAQEAQGMFGALDGRLSLVERKTDVNAAEIATMKAASGVRLK